MTPDSGAGLRGRALDPSTATACSATPPCSARGRTRRQATHARGSRPRRWASLMTHVNFLKVSCDQSLDDERHTPFTDNWIEQLQPERLRRRMVGIEELITLLT